jgi:hypothetical protein
MNPPTDLSRIDWRKSRESQQDGNCVEVGLVVRDER